MSGDGGVLIGQKRIGGVIPSSPEVEKDLPAGKSHGRRVQITQPRSSVFSALGKLSSQHKNEPQVKLLSARKVDVDAFSGPGVLKQKTSGDPVKLARSQSLPVSLTEPTPAQLLGPARYSVDDSMIDRSSTSGKDNIFLAGEGRELKSTAPTEQEKVTKPKRRRLGSVAKKLKTAKAFLSANGKTPKLSDHVLMGMDKVANYENQGIPRSYLEKTQKVADELGIIVAIRPVELICKTLIEEGAESKGLNIKGKSSNWGPMAGFIPFDQKFSKVAAIKDPAERAAAIEKYNTKNEASVREGHATVEHLALSQKRMDELTGMGILHGAVRINPSEGYTSALTFQSHPNGGKDQTFEAQLRPDGKWDIFSGTGDQREELMVIPKTADFDLLFNFSPFDQVDLGSSDRLQAADSELGIYSKRTLKLIDAMNAEYDRGEGKNMVHHGTDINNPVTDMDANLPATVMIPKSMQGKMGIYQKSPLLIKTYDELEKLFRTMRDAGIKVESNPLWGKMTGVVKENFDKKVDFFERRSSLPPDSSDL
ncbi:CyaA/EF/ExoY family adenylyl cyclase toxin [Sansalvadorimonas sp. 2012CJ34-2]|uniref:CyaA/EF/ExoY family adenylyl cyclase toxin n=1 Tax=Parendozoicomonas callyspongiae TaxID=2942213 RepID=A0ABT0PG93_9GAMM|nr:CyaA/EF/ExoY family adenylyl cyclase toxin [Sansalvadorimonas sp. 2012CJ34-2]MCL6270353.1 CyaA/EF/ExoY family adenylyl cyclase toxin [Sansalvadorimonas sp. 2012CJ34-2]